MSDNPILPQEILKSQILRSKELYLELKSEVEKDINNSNVSLRTLEITEDILTKLRNCLDKSINLLQRSKGLPQSKYLYFPICSQLLDFENKIRSSPFSDLILLNCFKMQVQKYRETEIGLIPENWEVIEIGNLFDIKVGGDLDKLQYSDVKDRKHIFPIYSNSI